jgi:hypothetical protein
MKDWVFSQRFSQRTTRDGCGIVHWWIAQVELLKLESTRLAYKIFSGGFYVHHKAKAKNMLQYKATFEDTESLYFILYFIHSASGLPRHAYVVFAIHNVMNTIQAARQKFRIVFNF